MTTSHYGIDRLVTYCYSCTIPQWVQWHWANFHLCMAISANHHGSPPTQCTCQGQTKFWFTYDRQYNL